MKMVAGCWLLVVGEEQATARTNTEILAAPE
jgi:hypothetical protein